MIEIRNSRRSLAEPSLAQNVLIRVVFIDTSLAVRRSYHLRRVIRVMVSAMPGAALTVGLKFNQPPHGRRYRVRAALIARIALREKNKIFGRIVRQCAARLGYAVLNEVETDDVGVRVVRSNDDLYSQYIF